MSLVKRQRRDGTSSALTTSTNSPSISSDVAQLAGHSAEVLAVDFDATGKFLLSASADRSIMLWDIHQQFANTGILSGHKGAVLDVKFSRDTRRVYSCSSDLTVSTWDVDTGERLVKHIGHEDMVNSIAVTRRGSDKIVSGSDDGSIGLWTPESKHCELYWTTPYPILAVACDEMASMVYSTGIESIISAWDTRNTSKPAFTLPGHGGDTITGLDLSSNGEVLVSNGQDNTVRTWNVRPFVAKEEDRKLMVYDGATHSIEQQLHRVRFSPDSQKIVAGSADTTTVVWATNTKRLLGKFPGHIGAVNGVAATDSLLASASSDRTIIVGPLP